MSESTCAAQCSEPLGELVERGGYLICESCAQFWDSWEDLSARPLSPDELLRHVREVGETGDAIAAELKRAGISYPFQAQSERSET